MFDLTQSMDRLRGDRHISSNNMRKVFASGVSQKGEKGKKLKKSHKTTIEMAKFKQKCKALGGGGERKFSDTNSA